MAKPYIAELHDIGKLVDTEALRKVGVPVSGHTFLNFDFAKHGMTKPNSPSWWGQWHEGDNLKSLRKTSGLPSNISDESKACVFLTKIADTIAGSISRPWGKKGGVEEGVRLLWRPDFYEERKRQDRHWAAFRTREDLKHMFAFIDQCQSPEKFLIEYGDNLELTAEDKSAPLNIIPLRAHVELTGKVFRVLRHWSRLVYDNLLPYLEYDQQRVEQVTNATGGRADEEKPGKWVFRLVACDVRFPQMPARLQDLNVLRLRREKIDEIVQGQNLYRDVERQPYAVLFHTEDFFCLFMPKEPILSLHKVTQPLLSEGFWLEYKEVEGDLNLLTSTAHRTYKQLINKYGDRGNVRSKRHFEFRHSSIWPGLERVVKPPICDICQQRRGIKYIKDEVREWICPVCRGIREMGEPASEFAAWDEYGQPAAWLKISLDQELLLRCLQRLFGSYVDSAPGMDKVPEKDRQDLKESFRPLAAQMEFVRHYKELLDRFHDALWELKDRFGKAFLKEDGALIYPIEGYKELAIVRLDRPETISLVMEVFAALLEEYFPGCLVDCPVRLSVSAANVKYPYHEHWRFLEKKQEAGVVFHLQEPGIRELRLTAEQFQTLREKLKGRRISHSLHNLAGIEAEAGELFATIEAFKDRQQLKELLETGKFTLKQILDYYRMVGVSGEEVSAYAR